MDSSEHTASQALQPDVREWFERRTFQGDQFADIDALVQRKRELESTLTVVLPAREVATTIGPILERIGSLNERHDLVDQVIVIDAASQDGSAAIAAEHGAEVHQQDELLPQFGPTIGKGDAMWRSLSVVRGDAVAFIDADSTEFDRGFVTGLFGALTAQPGIKFVKAAYTRPFGDSGDSGGRVTELTAKPLFNVFFPELAGFGQPLSGELIASTELLRSIPFCSGYAAETAMMIDVLRAAGLDAMAQVDVGVRHNSSQSLFALSSMAYAVTRTVLMRAGVDVADSDDYLHAYCPPEGLKLERESVRIVERPPIAEVIG